MSHGSFTGRTRDRRTSWRVRLADVVARSVITVGGIGTIVAVLTVGVFLVVSVLPLFLPASLAPLPPASVSWSGGAPLHLALDEYQTMAAAVLPDGRVEVFSLVGGAAPASANEPNRARLAVERLTPEGGPKITAWSFSPTSADVAIGFEDGTFRTGQIGFAASFLDPSRLDAEKKAALAGVLQGQYQAFDGGLVTLTGTMQYRWQRLSLTLGDPQPVDPQDKSPVVRVDHFRRGEIASTCLLQESGALRFRTGPQLDPPRPTPLRKLGYAASAERGPPDWVRLTGLAENVLLVWRDGHCMRFATAAGPKNAPPIEEVDLTPDDGVAVTAFEMLLGRKTLIVGDTKGRLAGWFRVRPPQSPNRDGAALTRAHEFAGVGAAVSRVVPSAANQTFAAAFASGAISVYHMTTDRLIVAADVVESANRSSETNVAALALGADGVKPVMLAATGDSLRGWRLTSPHPEVSVKGLLGHVWYESYPAPEFVWQSSGGEGYEPKFSLVPLIFGTLKATFYSLLFGVPIALMAAIYTSEFLTPGVKAMVKPSIELMASLPSVVLGFLGGLVLAPLVDQNLGFTLSLLGAVPATLLLGSFLWQLLPYKLGLQLAPYRFLAILAVAPLGVWLAWLVGPELENLFFDGNLRAWLRGPSGESYGSTLGAWTFLLLPLSVVACVAFVSLVVNPWQREQVHHWSRSGCAWFELFKFVAGAAAAVGLAMAVAAALGAAGLDPRGSGSSGGQSYDQRNALIVGFVMGFAIIPLIYTISEDALSAVPEHLRSASLGAGATPWQTAVRIIIPTAMSGLFSAVMIGLGRAVGETMIVLMATGNTPIMDLNVFNGFRTLSASLAEELPESVPGTTHYRILFLAGLTLFVTTFVINTAAEWVRLRFRRRSHAV